LPNGLLAYRVDFENESDASAPAQQVVISDSLNANLDLAQLQWTEIGWGDQLIIVPPNTQHFETTVPVSHLGIDFVVQVELDLNLTSGQAYAIFRSVDPTTGLPPAVDVGFLPPEDGTGRGMGHVSYTINAKPNLATGTEIRNVASISFDNQPGIATNQRDPHNPGAGTDPDKACLNTMDSGAPTSQVLALPPTVNQSELQVDWTGQDDPLGSGIATYDIYFSEDGGPWRAWMEQTADATAKLAVENGHTYAFFSVARDYVGNVEPGKVEAEAQTTVKLEKVVPVVAWANPADIAYGQPLSSVQLNATANVPGTFAYNPPAGVVLNAGNGQVLSVAFTPNDTANYSTVSATVNINVAKAASVITWAKPADILYGTPLGSAQLNATANVPGSFSYSPPAGTVLNAGVGQVLSVNFTPTDTLNYRSGVATAMLVVKPAPLTATANNATRSYGAPNPPFSGTLVGVVGSDGITASYSTSANASSPVGTYDIVPSLNDPNNRLGNYLVTLNKGTLTVTADDAPVITLTRASFDYYENAGTVVLDEQATVTDGGSADLDTGTLTVELISNGSSDDRLSIRDESVAAGEIGVNGSDVTFGGVVIGAFSGGTDGATPLVVVLNANCTPVAAQALVRNLTFENASEQPDELDRTVRLTLTDGDGGAGNAELVIHVHAVPDDVALTWANPVDIVYGTALGTAQLNATANVPGTFVYTPPAGTVLNAGAGQVLSVNFMPTDTANYNPASATVTINVAKTTPVITWANPADIVCGTALGAAQLNATADVPGTFVYTPPAGTVLNAGADQVLSVGFTPTDTANHHPASATVTISVAKAAPVITWASPAEIMYGTALGASQLNATANVPGTFVYTPPAGTVLNAGAGQFLSANFTPTDTVNYLPATATVTINVAKATPAITWVSPADIAYGTPLGASQLNASANVPGTFVYTPPAGTVLNAGAGQVLSASFTPTDTANYNSASATVTINVAKATPLITWANPADIVYGTALGAAQLNATANVPGTFVYTPPAGTVLNAGPGQVLSASFTPTDTANYNPASATVRINVAESAPEIAVEQPVGTDLEDGKATIDFGTVAVGSSTSLTFTVLNTANGPLTDLAVTIDGTNEELFTIPEDPAPTVEAGDSTTFTVRFAPTSTGPATAALHLTNNDADENPFDLALTGQGANSAPTVAVDHVTVTVNEGSVASNTGTFSDSQGNSTVTLSSSVGAVTTDNGAGTWNWTFSCADGPDQSQAVIITANDGTGPVTTTFALVVNNVAPLAIAQSVSTLEDTPINLTLAVTDPGIDTVSRWTITQDPAHGTLSGVAPLLTYNPAANYNGPDSFEFTAADSDAATGSAAIVIVNITPVNDVPVANAQTVTTTKNNALPIRLTASDVDNDPLSYNIVTGPTHGSLSGAPPSTIYTPVSDYAGPDSFTFTVGDGIVDSAPATVSISVTDGGGGTTFDNTAKISVPGFGRASPYPSVISVSGLQGVVSDVTVQLRGLTHTWPGDLDILLVGPTKRKALIMSDVGGNNAVSGIDLTLKDSASSVLPNSGKLLSGVYKPSNYGVGDVFMPPAPLLGGCGSAFSVFKGASPNGTWSLFVMDDLPLDKGAIGGGWVLTIQTVPAVGPASASTFEVVDDSEAVVPPDETPQKGPELTVEGLDKGAKLQLRVRGLPPNAAYALESSGDLATWRSIVDGVAESIDFTLSVGTSENRVRAFYRIRVK
jgi:hypothetical protein